MDLCIALLRMINVVTAPDNVKKPRGLKKSAPYAAVGAWRSNMKFRKQLEINLPTIAEESVKARKTLCQTEFGETLFMSSQSEFVKMYMYVT